MRSLPLLLLACVAALLLVGFGDATSVAKPKLQKAKILSAAEVGKYGPAAAAPAPPKVKASGYKMSTKSNAAPKLIYDWNVHSEGSIQGVAPNPSSSGKVHLWSQAAGACKGTPAISAPLTKCTQIPASAGIPAKSFRGYCDSKKKKAFVNLFNDPNCKVTAQFGLVDGTTQLTPQPSNGGCHPVWSVGGKQGADGVTVTFPSQIAVTSFECKP
jgi:hypothetical protein